MPCNQAAFIRKVQLLTNHLVDYITTRLNNFVTKFKNTYQTNNDV